MKHISGSNFGEGTWDGLLFTWKREGKPDLVFHWNECSSEYRLSPDKRGESAIVWNWREERFLQFLPVLEQPKLWKFLKPVSPPLALCVEILSVALSGQDILSKPKVTVKHEKRRIVRTKSKKNPVPLSVDEIVEIKPDPKTVVLPSEESPTGDKPKQRVKPDKVTFKDP